MNNIILLKKENAFNHMGECIKMGCLGKLLVSGHEQVGGGGIVWYSECQMSDDSNS
jgi:hypothetical protein